MLRKLHHLFSAPSTRVSERNYLLPSAKVDNGESANDTGFGLRNPLEIGTFLRLLATRQDFLTADYGNGQIITRVLDIDAKSKTFTFDYGASKTGNHAVLAASKLRFSALPDGVKVNFTTGKPHEISRDGIAAFEVELPQVLIRVQRREYFRVAPHARSVFWQRCAVRGTALPSGNA
ncbi:flagellar brake protein [Paraburkholderia sp. RCC_158]|uniref:flagellar brake protein n=1 Tax=Paraburkholderia sp. RCC_158 TaxID=3239220 RepID=UPI003525DBFB